jgi:DNA-binding transcriptional ArsR family regulator
VSKHFRQVAEQKSKEIRPALRRLSLPWPLFVRRALGELSVGELARPFKISGPAITKHLKVLQRVGLITRGRHAQWRPCRLEANPLRDVAAWVEEYRRFWDESFDRLDEYLADLQKKEKHDGTK